jgi:hypothetical protein
MASADAVIDQIHYLMERAFCLEEHGHCEDAIVLVDEARDLAASLREKKPVLVYS